jgi:hypothetical protein
MTTPTPEQFLAAPPDPDEDEEPAAPVEPLESIAGSLRYLVDRYDAEHAEEKLSDTLREEYDDLDSKYAAAFEVIEQIEATVKPSTSKLANSVRAVIGRWKNPKVEPVNTQRAVEPVDEEPETPPVIATLEPEPDADVEAWRAYARGRGYQDADVDRMNRSQIRTMLGIEQPTGVQ